MSYFRQEEIEYFWDINDEARHQSSKEVLQKKEA